MNDIVGNRFGLIVINMRIITIFVCVDGTKFLVWEFLALIDFMFALTHIRGRTTEIFTFVAQKVTGVDAWDGQPWVYNKTLLQYYKNNCFLSIDKSIYHKKIGYKGFPRRGWGLTPIIGETVVGQVYQIVGCLLRAFSRLLASGRSS